MSHDKINIRRPVKPQGNKVSAPQYSVSPWGKKEVPVTVLTCQVKVLALERGADLVGVAAAAPGVKECPVGREEQCEDYREYKNRPQ